jgi:hypothetical protein
MPAVKLLRPRIDAVVFRNRDELLLSVILAEFGSDALDFGEVAAFQHESVCAERLLRIFDEPLSELRMFDGAPYDGANHLVSH